MLSRDCFWLLETLSCRGVESACETPSEQLSLRSSSGRIHPRNSPTFIAKDQYCKWTFPNETYKGQGLLVFIDQVDLVSRLRDQNAVRVGDLSIGEFWPIAKHASYMTWAYIFRWLPALCRFSRIW